MKESISNGSLPLIDECVSSDILSTWDVTASGIYLLYISLFSGNKLTCLFQYDKYRSVGNFRNSALTSTSKELYDKSIIRLPKPCASNGIMSTRDVTASGIYLLYISLFSEKKIKYHLSLKVWQIQEWVTFSNSTLNSA